MMNGDMGSWYTGMGSGNWTFGLLIGTAVVIVIVAAIKYLGKNN